MKKFAALGFVLVIACAVTAAFVLHQSHEVSPPARVSIHHPQHHDEAHESHHAHNRHFNPDFKWGDLQRALKQRRQILARSVRPANAASNNGWTPLGPGNIGGRTLAIYVDPGNPKHLVIGTAGGGIWTSSNAGQSWAPVNDFMGSLAVNAIARGPVTGTLYAGTGEYDAGDGMLGAGIFTSTDNGNTWTALASTNPVNDNAWYFTTALAINPNGVILASTWKGVMRSTDGGQTWTQTRSGLAGDVVFDPDNPNNALIDVSPNLFPTGGSNSYVAYSTDAGTTWTRVQLASGAEVHGLVINSPAGVAGSYIIGGAKFNPAKVNVTADLIVATNASGTISDGCTPPFANAAAIAGKIALIERGTCNFTLKVKNAQNVGALGAIIVDNVDEPVFTMSGADSTITIPSFVITKRDGATIERALESGPVNATMTIPYGSGSGRVRLAYAKSVPGLVYAAVDYQEGTMFKSVDGGKTWAQLAVVRNQTEKLYDIGAGDQGGYDDPLWVDPTDANHLVAGGIDLWQSGDGGKTWTQISDWTRVPISPHADHHAIAASGSRFYDGDDGGVYTTNDIANATTTSGWTSLNNGLGITQFYSVAGKASALSSHNGGAAPIIGGTQDNGCDLYTGNINGWIEYAGGDGGYAAVNPANGDDLYCEYVFADINRSLDGGATIDYPGDSIPDVSTQSANFIAPFVLEPNRPDTLLVGGQSLWRSSNVETVTPLAWNSINGSTLPVTAGNYISAIAVARGDANDIWVGYNDGSVWRTGDGTGTSPAWSQVNGIGGPAQLVSTGANAQGAVNRIVVDPANRQSIYVMFESFTGSNLWHSADGGASWSDLGAGLPDAPVFDIAINPVDPQTLYAATEVGLFTSTDGGNTWSTSNDGPANVRIRDLDWYDSAQLIAATHGRGIWEMTLVDANPAPAVTAISPARVELGGGDFTLAVNGKNFLKGAVVSLDSTRLATTFVSATQLNAQVPAALITRTGGHFVTVTNPAPSVVSPPETLMVANPTPALTGLTPSDVKAGSGGFTLVVAGDNFVSGAKVSFGTTLLVTSFESATQLKAQVPAALVAQAGHYNVTVSNPAPSDVSNAETFTVAASHPPGCGLCGGGGDAGGGGGEFGVFALGLLLALVLIRRRRQP